MARNLIKLASAEGRTFALGQTVTTEHGTGRIKAFVRSVDCSFIVAKVRIGKKLVRAILQDLGD